MYIVLIFIGEPTRGVRMDRYSQLINFQKNRTVGFRELLITRFSLVPLRRECGPCFSYALRVM